jgi:hypothetical protein
VSEVVEELAKAPIGDVLTELRGTVEGLSRIVNGPETEAMLVALKG